MSVTESVHLKTATANQFTVEIGSTTIARISSVSGLSMGMEVADSKMGGDGITHKRPVSPTFEDITIKRPFWSDDRDFSDYWDNWFNATGVVENGSVVLYNNGASGATEEVARWNFTECFPSKYSISDFDAGSTDLVTEELTLTITTLRRAD